MSDQRSAYTQAGVHIEAGQQAVALMKEAVASTYTSAVLSEVGSFGGLFDMSELKTMSAPVLVASTDGVGTKTMVASIMNRWDTIGQDLVNHCINDILVQGARPLFFLDYIASSHLDPTIMADIVKGMAKACQQVGVALLGGETAEMPGVYQQGEVDVAGTIVGIVEREEILDGSTIQVGDVVMALPSTGLHTNGYTLARQTLAELDWHTPDPELDNQSIGDILLAIHHCYLNDIAQIKQAGIDMKGLAHITGGGIYDNLPRILPAGLGAKILRKRWKVPPIFKLIQIQANISEQDMFHAFNMGLGMLIVVSPRYAGIMQAIFPNDVYMIGDIVRDPEQKVVLV